MAWWTTVDGLKLPTQLAGHPALELVNTRAAWDQAYAPEQDYLVTLDHLVVLARINGLLGDDRATRLRRLASRAPDEAATIVARAQRLRADLHERLVGTATAAGTSRLAAAVGEARARQQLDLDGDGARWRFPGRPRLGEPLDAFLVSAGELLVDRPRVGACPGHGCGWLFLNRSGRRRWCTMAVCGNRAKQAAHQTRTLRH